MLRTIARTIFGTSNTRKLRSYRARLQKINDLEASVRSLPDSAFHPRTNDLRTRVQAGEDLDSVLPEAFALVREASRRVLGLRPYDVQLIGGMVLHDGLIAEMKTGEGKTLAATLPAYLNALTGKGVHIVTVNDYLAARDANWMGQVYQFLGLQVGTITHGIPDAERRAQYGADVTFVTNNELGFDYLRDNMRHHQGELVQRDFNYSIVDEIDSILIDEARTPLIISGPSEDESQLYHVVNALTARLATDPRNYELDEKARSVILTDRGVTEVEQMLDSSSLLTGGGLYDLNNISMLHYVYQGLRAHILFSKDVNYIVRDGQVVIIDEFTGRMMPGRRYSEGLHQALEAKENVDVQRENHTLASITFQNLFRLYPKLSGMTGTAVTEAEEFHDIYKLEVVEVPTNISVHRTDENDEIYRTEKEKFEALTEIVMDCRARNQPVLIGTTSIEKSEALSRIFDQRHIPHAVLNARFHEQEADIIAQAGTPGAVTIATNMAGRGTDIQLGGSIRNILESIPGNVADRSEVAEGILREQASLVRDAGGLFVIGTERHESRRIDNQLRGRSGRQGDPGRSKFLLSLEDDLMRIFGSDRIATMLSRLGLRSGEAIAHPWINTALEKAQKKVEARNFDMRKNLLRFDDVVDAQRREIYRQRKTILVSEDIHPYINRYIDEFLENIIVDIDRSTETNLAGRLVSDQDLISRFGISDLVSDGVARGGVNGHDFLRQVRSVVDDYFSMFWKNIPQPLLCTYQKRIVLTELDSVWIRHLHNVDLLRQGISLRAYGQRDPLHEFKLECFILFNDMLETLRTQTLLELASTDLSALLSANLETMDKIVNSYTQNNEWHADQAPSLDYREEGMPGRNQLCPCGSGRKYKHCHGKFA